jgi:hypothetical protein
VAKALKNSHGDQSSGGDFIGHDGRIALIEEIARSTESSLRTWGWLRSLSHVAGQRELDAILYPSTMAGASALIHRLETSGVDWLPMGFLEGRRSRSDRNVVAVSLRLLDENLLFDGERIRVHAGYSVSALAYAASERGLTGLEPLIQMRGSLGDFLRPGRRGELWHLVEEVVVARSGVLKIIFTRGEDLTSEQRSALEGALILAATLRLNRVENAQVRLDDGDIFPTYSNLIDGGNRHRGAADSNGEVIPLAERSRGRAARELQLELEYGADAWRDDF